MQYNKNESQDFILAMIVSIAKQDENVFEEAHDKFTEFQFKITKIKDPTIIYAIKKASVVLEDADFETVTKEKPNN